MTLDKNYSTINKNKKIISVDADSTSSPRILVKIKYPNYSESIEVGDIIRYDALNMQYVKSIANNSVNAEVFGIVESIDANLDLNVVTNGSIEISASKLINTTGSNVGGNDVYFLSGTSAGYLQNIGPTFDGYVIKPIYQIAPHGTYTGIVRNYIGYKKPENISYTTTILSISDDGSKCFSIMLPNNVFLFYTLTYGTSISQSLFDYITVPSTVEFNISTSDFKISNDGKHILIFNKETKKIYYLYLDNSVLYVKQELQIDISGIPANILWAADDELTSFTVSTRSLSRNATSNDFRITSHDSCSRILHFKRNVNSTSPFNWRQISEQHAFGSCDYGPIESSDFIDPTHGLTDDDVDLSAGIFRTCDLYCKKKNYALSTFCLGQDQKDYRSKSTGYYVKYQGLYDPFTYIDGYRNLTRVDGSALTFIDTQLRSPFFKDFVPTQNQDDNTIRYFKCNFGIKSYKIHNKIGDYYYEDFSATQNTGIKFYRPLQQSLDLSTDTLLPSSISILAQLSSRAISVNSTAVANITPTFSQNALWSSTSCTDSFIVFAFLYEYVNTSNQSKKKNLVVIKFPFMSYDDKTVFRYFMQSSVYSTIIPDMTGYGLISNFITSTPTPVTTQYFTAIQSQTTSPSIESPSLINQLTITNPNIDQLTTFKLFTSDNRYFLCTNSTVIIWTYSSSTYITRALDLSAAKFYNLISGEYFLLNGIMYYYNPASTQFEQKAID